MSGGILVGGILSRGDFGWGDFVRGDFVRGDFVRGDFVLEPVRGIKVRKKHVLSFMQKTTGAKAIS